jgi:hypothetical protein
MPAAMKAGAKIRHEIWILNPSDEYYFAISNIPTTKRDSLNGDIYRV